MPLQLANYSNTHFCPQQTWTKARQLVTSHLFSVQVTFHLLFRFISEFNFSDIMVIIIVLPTRKPKRKYLGAETRIPQIVALPQCPPRLILHRAMLADLLLSSSTDITDLKKKSCIIFGDLKGARNVPLTEFFIRPLCGILVSAPPPISDSGATRFGHNCIKSLLMTFIVLYASLLLASYLLKLTFSPSTNLNKGQTASFKFSIKGGSPSRPRNSTTGC